MPTLRVIVSLRVDGELLHDFPLERRITGNEAIELNAILPNGVYTNADYGLAGLATLLHFDAAATAKIDNDAPTTFPLNADSVYLHMQSVTMRFTPTANTRVRGVM